MIEFLFSSSRRRIPIVQTDVEGAQSSRQHDSGSGQAAALARVCRAPILVSAIVAGSPIN